MGRDPIGACRTHDPSQSCPAHPGPASGPQPEEAPVTNSESKAQQVIVGVDTHKYVHGAVAIDTRATRLGDHAFVANAGGLSGF